MDEKGYCCDDCEQAYYKDNPTQEITQKEGGNMRVRDLIKKLQKYPNQESYVFIYDVEESELHKLGTVDLAISDRVDLNIKEGG